MIVAVVPCRYETAQDVAQLRAQLLEFVDDVVIATRPGLGPAYLEAWQSIPMDAMVVHVDVGSYDRDSWLSVINNARRADIVIGSRFVKDGRHVGSWWRKFTSKRAAAACRLVTFRSYHDWTSGLRAYSPKARAVLSCFAYQTSGHAWQIEALWVGDSAGLSIAEVPITYRVGKSSLNRKRVWEALKLWWAMAWSSPPSSEIPLLTSTDISTKSTGSVTD